MFSHYFFLFFFLDDYVAFINDKIMATTAIIIVCLFVCLCVCMCVYDNVKVFIMESIIFPSVIKMISFFCYTKMFPKEWCMYESYWTLWFLFIIWCHKKNKQTVRKSQEMNKTKQKSWNKTGNHESILIEVYILDLVIIKQWKWTKTNKQTKYKTRARFLFSLKGFETNNARHHHHHHCCLW